MDREKPKSKDKALFNQKKNREFRRTEKIKDVKEIKSIPFINRSLDSHHDNHQITSFKEGFWFWSRESYWFYLNQGLFWGVIIGFTSILSASCGVALTKIDVVERKINQAISRSSSVEKSTPSQELVHPVNVLLLEVEPNKDEIIQFSQAFTGKSKTILLLRFEPQSKKVKVINIPTDSRVKIPEFGWGTISDANQYGGTALVSATIAQLLDGITIDRYIRATPSTFQKFIASGKIKSNSCNARVQNCSDYQEKIVRQQIVIETIRQRLNIPSYFKSFRHTFTNAESDLDTDLSLLEAMSLASFVREVESDNIAVNLVAGYIASRDIEIEKSDFNSVRDSSRLIKSQSLNQNNYSTGGDRSFEDLPIAVQNTTDSPELGMRFVSYLRRQNFQDVYLVEHIPLRLDKTKIIINQSQLARAKRLTNIIGFGRLEPKSHSQQKPLIIQIGEDAHHLPLNNPTY